MWTETNEGRQTIEQVSRHLVTEVAPEELGLFDALMADYFADPTPPDPADADSDGPLEFGLGEALVAVTPAAAAVATAVLTYILTEVIKTTQVESAKAITNKIKKLFNLKEKTEALTTDQLKQVQKMAIKQAKLFGLAGDQAKQLASSLVGSLALVD
jgi:hypothetical protein